jgi:hypothetical protein
MTEARESHGAITVGPLTPTEGRNVGGPATLQFSRRRRLKRDAVEALARGERLVRTDTGTDTERLNHLTGPMAVAG